MILLIYKTCNQEQFLNKEIIMKCLTLKSFARNSWTPHSKIIIAIQHIVTIKNMSLHSFIYYNSISFLKNSTN